MRALKLRLTSRNLGWVLAAMCAAWRSEPVGATDLLVTSHATNSVKQYRWPSGSYVGDFVGPGAGMLSAPIGIRVRPTAPRNLFVVSNGNNSVIQYDGLSGALVGTFVPPASGGLLSPWALGWGSNGNLYVTSDVHGGGAFFNGECVRQYDDSGTYVTNSPCEDGPLDNAVSHAIVFRPNGNFYVAWTGISSIPPPVPTEQIREYNAGGGFVRSIALPSSDLCHGLAVGPNGNLFASLLLSDRVIQINSATGAIIGNFVAPGTGGLDWPEDLVFDPSGNLLVASSTTDRVLRFNGGTGAYMGDFVSAGSGGLDWPLGLAFMPFCAPMIAEISDETRSVCAIVPEGPCTLGPGVGYFVACASVANPSCGSPVTWSLVSGPPGMTINAVTGAVTMTAAPPVGVYPITIAASNPAGSDEESWVLTITGGDMTCNGIINAEDIAGFTACFVAGPAVTPGCEAADIDGDGDIDADDLALFVGLLLS